MTRFDNRAKRIRELRIAVMDEVPASLEEAPLINSGAARVSTRLGPIELACYQPSVPAHDGVGLRGISHILKGFTAKAMRDFSECHSLRVSEPQRGFELSFEDPVFGSKILTYATGVPGPLSR